MKKYLLPIFMFILMALSQSCSTTQKYQTSSDSDFIELKLDRNYQALPEIEEEPQIAHTIFDSGDETPKLDLPSSEDLIAEPEEVKIVENVPQESPGEETYAFYIVEKSDNLSSIAKKLYKDSNQWEKILSWNKDTISNPNKIYPKMKIKYVPDDNHPQRVLSGDTESTFAHYLIKKNDSLSKISKKIFGKLSQWKALYEWNKHILSNPNLILPGTSLKYRTEKTPH